MVAIAIYNGRHDADKDALIRSLAEACGGRLCESGYRAADGGRRTLEFWFDSQSETEQFCAESPATGEWTACLASGPPLTKEQARDHYGELLQFTNEGKDRVERDDEFIRWLKPLVNLSDTFEKKIATLTQVVIWVATGHGLSLYNTLPLTNQITQENIQAFARDHLQEVEVLVSSVAARAFETLPPEKA